MATINEIQASRCPKCEAPPNVVCTLSSGQRANSFHNERSQFANHAKATLAGLGLTLRTRKRWRWPA